MFRAHGIAADIPDHAENRTNNCRLFPANLGCEHCGGNHEHRNEQHAH
ncbi:hypothetical protein SDC9_119864 [bioreactor metagenome]|uniref:Uncharacterized protein n=1 Tax=bioreactor metagenome TaxID=1076179 RepID=A0A645C690_9ZZZZ